MQRAWDALHSPTGVAAAPEPAPPATTGPAPVGAAHIQRARAALDQAPQRHLQSQPRRRGEAPKPTPPPSARANPVDGDTNDSSDTSGADDDEDDGDSPVELHLALGPARSAESRARARRDTFEARSTQTLAALVAAQHRSRDSQQALATFLSSQPRRKRKRWHELHDTLQAAAENDRRALQAAAKNDRREQFLLQQAQQDFRTAQDDRRSVEEAVTSAKARSATQRRPPDPPAHDPLSL